ncbi:MAG: hypothetical protein KGZ25_06280 [Planctomycetes bacterium]|nr:hypothetical protein [Planctomycetota bacterium]
MSTKIVVLGLLICVTVSGQKKQKEWPYGGTVAKFQEAPQLDGKIGTEEWKPAVRVFGFQQRRGGDNLEERKAVTYLGFTEKRLYLAVVSELPPDGKLITTQKNRDSSLIRDDSVEIWIDPHWKKRKAGKGNQTYFQTMINSAGTIFDKKYDPAGGTPSMGWNGDWKTASGIHKKTGPDSPIQTQTGIWVCEASIPFDDVGMTGSPIGHEIGVMVARQWKRPGAQKPWFPHAHSFSSWTEYPHFRLTKSHPTVQMMEFGDELFEGNLEMEALIINPGPSRTVQVETKATSSDMPSMQETVDLKLPAQGEKLYEFTTHGRFHATAQHHLDFSVTGEKGESTYFHYAMDWRKPGGKRWTVKTGPNPKKAIKLAYYPSYEFIRIFVDPRELGKEAEGIQQADVAVLNPKGEKVTGGRMEWEKAPAERRFKVGELSEGKYTAQVSLKGYGKTYERHFVRKYFPWEGNGLGETTKVYPPFEPITVDGHTVSVVMRRHEVSGLGFWESVEARGNDEGAKYLELLAGPIALKADGKVLEGTGEFESRRPHAVKYEGKAVHPAVTVKTRMTTEFDGCSRIEMTLAPGSEDKELKTLSLDIPLKDSLMPLFHATTTGLRRNPAGYLPEGTGRVWDGRDNPDGNWYGNFMPYVWVGAEERGLCWFADNDRNWVLETGEKPEEVAPCQELIREDGTLHLRINFVQKPVSVDEPRKIVFGLMASPAKPMPKNWRNVLFEHGVEDRRSIKWIGAQYWGSPSIMYNKYPINGDFSVLDKMQELRLGGKMGDFWRYYNARNLSGDISDSTYMSPKKIRQLLSISFRRAQRAEDNYFCAYWEEFHRTLSYHPEVPVFRQEWSGKYSGTGHHSYPESYLDFACYYAAEFVRRGIGTYFDNTFPKRAYDPVTTGAYRLANGQMQPSANMWRHRRYLKRIWTLHAQMGPEKTPPIMMLHMTNTHVVPYMVFNHSNLDLEWFYGPEPLQSKFTADLLRAESLGLQTGNYPLALSNVRGPGWKKKSANVIRKARKTRFAGLMVHEIRTRPTGKVDRGLLNKMLQFGYGLEGCRVYNYWDARKPLETSDPKCKWLLAENQGKLMLLLCTWNAEKGEVEVRLDHDALHSGIREARNAETGKSIDVKGGRFNFSMPGYGVRLFWLQE